MDIKDLMKYAHEGNATDFEASFQEMMGEKIGAALETRTQEVAASMYAQETDTNEDV